LGKRTAHQSSGDQASGAAHDDGFLTASLQATPMAEALYARIGFTAVGTWEEWVR
jgi:hypothetical protein